MDALNRHVDPSSYLGVLGLATDIRLQQAPIAERAGVENQALYVNPFIVGGMQRSLGVVYTEQDLIEELLRIAEKAGL